MSAQFWWKAALTVVIVLAASFLARRHGWVGALVASLPLTSLLVLGWLYAETRNPFQVADLAMSIFWFVLGSLPFFLVLAFGLRNGWHWGISAAAAVASGFAGVSVAQWLMARGTV
ncbi:MAG: DUF3147 family protein [Pseudomonadota bacterium]|nr:DUF3147 family protein [Pseudomonadota bacterium]